ncbi:hypothetical protein DH2020_018027 [Rehmannia glutinosa]|uniref:AT-hook motif nuclear-localized protein n=1 Tax=Rehmannia glutinosa TaxID=99300 RepID=A0ABR0WLX1_REHGL
MEMEDKESTESGSPGSNSEIDSPPSSGGGFGGEDSGAAGGGGGMVPGIINTAVNISMEKNAGMVSSPALPVGGGGVIESGGGVIGGGPIGVGGGGGQLLMGRKKRGRPRKYDSEGNLNAAYVKSPPVAAAQTAAQPGFTLSTPPSYEYTSGPKRGPSGSGNWNALASLGELFAKTAGGDFTPHVVTVYTGEVMTNFSALKNADDVAGEILTFAQKGVGGVCVLSANGSVSNVTIRQPGSSGGLLTYEGRFEILSLTGSYTICDSGGIKSRTGGLSVTLASPDGRVIGGCLAGSLMAANPIQIVIGSFVPNGYKMPKRKQQNVHRISPSPSFQFAPDTVTAAIPISQAAPESNIYPMLNPQLPIQSQDNPNSASTDTSDWNGSGPSSDQRPSPDINISIPIEEH